MKITTKVKSYISRRWWRVKYRFPFRLWSDVRFLVRSVKWAWQRVTKGWSDRDTWSLDHHLARVISESVKRLSDRCLGVPIEFSSNDAQWQEVLNKISKGFEQYNIRDDCKECGYGWEYCSSHPKEIEDESWELLRKYFGNLWD